MNAFRLTRSPAVPENVIAAVSPAVGIVTTSGAPPALIEPVITVDARPDRSGRSVGKLRLDGPSG